MDSATQAQTVARLLKVIANAEFQMLPGFYVFEALPGASRRPARMPWRASATATSGASWCRSPTPA